MKKVECKIKPYFYYPEKNGKSLVTSFENYNKRINRKAGKRY